MQHILKYFFLLFATLVIFACSHDKQADKVIDNALAVVEEDPDSALSILNNIKGEVPTWSKRQRMHYALAYAQAQNKAFVPVTGDSTLQEVVRYYESHGTKNEQMLANYMLGCVYRDRGDALNALKAYQAAIAAVDTTKADCDLRTLSRIHSQMGSLYHNVAALEEEQSEYLIARSLAWEAGDTLTALRLMWTLATGLHIHERYDESIALIDSMAVLEKQYGWPECVECIYPMKIDIHLINGDIVGSKTLLREYEKKLHIGPLSPDTAIANIGYHYYKGRYYLLNSQPDSALVQFRRLMSRSSSIDLRELAYKGLIDSYSKKHNADSVIKYANLYCIANDSTTKQRSSEHLIRMTALYNYTKAQETAQRLEEESARLRILVLLLAMGALTIGGGLWYYHRLRQKQLHQEAAKQNAEYLLLMQMWEKTKSELQMMKSNTSQLIQEKEEEMARLRQAMEVYRADVLDLDQWNAERELLNSEVIKYLHSLAAIGKRATPNEVTNFDALAHSAFPDFFKKLCVSPNSLTPHEILICTFIRFRFISSEIAILLDLSPQRVTNIKSKINKKRFGDPSAKTLVTNLRSLED